MTKRIHPSSQTEPANQSSRSQPNSNLNKKVNLTALDKLAKAKTTPSKREREIGPLSPSPTKTTSSVRNFFRVEFPGSPQSPSKTTTSPEKKLVVDYLRATPPSAPKKRSKQLNLFADIKENDVSEQTSPFNPKKKTTATPSALSEDDLSFSFLKERPLDAMTDVLLTDEKDSSPDGFIKRKKRSDLTTSPLSPQPRSPTSFSFLKRKEQPAAKEARPTEEIDSPSGAFLIRKHNTVSQISPPAPKKAAPCGRRPRILSPFETRLNALKLNEFKLADERECKVSYLAKGTFSNVYTLAESENPIILGIDNSALVLKAFHGENSGFNEHKLRGYLVNIIDNYNHCKALGLPVAEIYNAATAVQDGYIIQQKVDGSIDLLNASHRQQVQQFFNASIAKNLTMDLLPDNFKVVNGKVVLIDFVEEPEENDCNDEDPAFGVNIFNKRVCGGWFSCYKKLDLSNDQAAIFTNELSGNHYEDHIKSLVKDAKFAPPVPGMIPIVQLDSEGSLY